MLTGKFHRKAPKLVKNQAEGSKIDQIRTKQPTATVGIHHWIPTVAVGLNWWIPTVVWLKLAVWFLFGQFWTLQRDF